MIYMYKVFVRRWRDRRRISCTFSEETKLKQVVIVITRIMGLSSKLQQHTSTPKLISLLFAILHFSDALNGEIDLQNRDTSATKEKCLNQSNVYIFEPIIAKKLTHHSTIPQL